jgi:hypothetical protein
MRKSVTLLLILVFLIASSIATPLPVKAEPKTIVIPDDYPTIQEAIDHANTRDTVFVKAGNYFLPGLLHGIDIDKSISLIGENKQNTIITQKPYKYNEAAISISADNVTVSGFTIEGGIHNIMVGGSGCKIVDNNFLVIYSGVFFIGGTNNIISGNNINRNKTGSRGISLTSWGEESSDLVISNNTIASNGVGLDIEATQKVNITQNNIMSNGADGISLRGFGHFYVYENNITDNMGFGIQLSSNCNQSLIYNNNIYRNEIGVRLDSVGVGNKVYYNNLIGNNKTVVIETGLTDIVSWDNGRVGNYWSDYTGQGEYVIDGNNVDHYPLTQQVDITTTAPTATSTPPSGNLSLTIAVIATVTAVVIVIGLAVYFKKRKH